MNAYFRPFFIRKLLLQIFFCWSYLVSPFAPVIESYGAVIRKKPTEEARVASQDLQKLLLPPLFPPLFFTSKDEEKLYDSVLNEWKKSYLLSDKSAATMPLKRENYLELCQKFVSDPADPLVKTVKDFRANPKDSSGIFYATMIGEFEKKLKKYSASKLVLGVDFIHFKSALEDYQNYPQDKQKSDFLIASYNNLRHSYSEALARQLKMLTTSSSGVDPSELNSTVQEKKPNLKAFSALTSGVQQIQKFLNPSCQRCNEPEVTSKKIIKPPCEPDQEAPALTKLHLNTVFDPAMRSESMQSQIKELKSWLLNAPNTGISSSFNIRKVDHNNNNSISNNGIFDLEDFVSKKHYIIKVVNKKKISMNQCPEFRKNWELNNSIFAKTDCDNSDKSQALDPSLPSISKIRGWAVSEKYCFGLLEAARGESFYKVLENKGEFGDQEIPPKEEAELFMRFGETVGSLHYHPFKDADLDPKKAQYWTHGDLHGNNFFYDEKTKKFTLIDVDTLHARNELVLEPKAEGIFESTAAMKRRLGNTVDYDLAQSISPKSYLEHLLNHYSNENNLSKVIKKMLSLDDKYPSSKLEDTLRGRPLQTIRRKYRQLTLFLEGYLKKVPRENKQLILDFCRKLCKDPIDELLWHTKYSFTKFKEEDYEQLLNSDQSILGPNSMPEVRKCFELTK